MGWTNRKAAMAWMREPKQTLQRTERRTESEDFKARAAEHRRLIRDAWEKECHGKQTNRQTKAGAPRRF